MSKMPISRFLKDGKEQMLKLSEPELLYKKTVTRYIDKEVLTLLMWLVKEHEPPMKKNILVFDGKNIYVYYCANFKKEFHLEQFKETYYWQYYDDFLKIIKEELNE